jgi:hypothetical protein
MVRGFQVLMFMLCVLAGLYLLVYGPTFFMPGRDNPALGHLFESSATRLLGAGLLTVAGMGGIFLRDNYYVTPRRLPGPGMQKLYFALVVLAIALVSVAFNLATPMPNPDAAPTPATRPAAPDL